MAHSVHLSGDELLARLEQADFDPAIAQRISEQEFEAAAEPRPKEKLSARQRQFERATAVFMAGGLGAGIAMGVGALPPLVAFAVLATVSVNAAHSLNKWGKAAIHDTRHGRWRRDGMSPEAGKRIRRLEKAVEQEAEDVAFGRNAMQTMLGDQFENDRFLANWALAGKDTLREVRVPHIASYLVERIEDRYKADIRNAESPDTKQAAKAGLSALRQRAARPFKPGG